LNQLEFLLAIFRERKEEKGTGERGEPIGISMEGEKRKEPDTL